jgi:hypothetical protein
VVVGAIVSAGHAWPAMPVQFSSGSQRSPEPALQSVPAAVTMSAGQLGPEPVQFSSGSQRSPEPVRQTWLDEAKVSTGQAPLDPVQFSARSQSPAAARHRVLLDWKTSTHTLLLPVQWSAASLSQVPPCELPVQLVDDDWKRSAGQVPLDPVQFSATSH